MGLVFGFVAGLIVGWNFLPQPDWVKKIVDKVLIKLKLKKKPADVPPPETPAE